MNAQPVVRHETCALPEIHTGNNSVIALSSGIEGPMTTCLMHPAVGVSQINYRSVLALHLTGVYPLRLARFPPVASTREHHAIIYTAT